MSSEYKIHRTFPIKILPQTASSIYVTHDGRITVELYDWSSDAQSFVGNDVADMLPVSASEKPRIYRLLRGESNALPDPDDLDAELIDLFISRFSGYYDVKKWYEENNIKHRHETDLWA